MLTDTELAKLAATLSEAQRAALTKISIEPGLWTPVAALNRHSFRALERRGLARHYIIAMVSCARLTTLGAALRNHLTKETPRAE